MDYHDIKPVHVLTKGFMIGLVSPLFSIPYHLHRYFSLIRFRFSIYHSRLTSLLPSFFPSRPVFCTVSKTFRPRRLPTSFLHPLLCVRLPLHVCRQLDSSGALS
jgi:hypothetical protein